MRQIWRHRFRRSTVLLSLYLGVVTGVGMAHYGRGPAVELCWCAAFLAAMSWRKHSIRTLVACLVLGTCAGWWRGASYMARLSIYDTLHDAKITVTSRAMEDAVYGRNKQLTFSADHIRLADGRRLPGRIQLSGFGADAVFQGDEVAASGKLYDGYGVYQGSISYAKLSVKAHYPSVTSRLRQQFTAGMQTALPEPLAPFAMGLLVGQRANLPDAVKQDLLKVGLTHIIAVSGYNLTIILRASRRLLGGRSKRLSTLLSLGLTAMFLLLAGASASIVRAAIVSTLSLAASYYGREFKPLNLIFLAAAITAWANPVYVWSDLSWYLSFLAFFGVMVLSPLVQARWPGRWQRSIIGGVALESLCAEAMSEPFILHIFGQMSLVGLPANVLVVALIPLAMLLGLIAGLAGMLIGTVSGWFTWPATILLDYMLNIAHILAGLPHIFLHDRSLSLAGMLVLYAVIGACTLVLRHKTSTPPNAIITDRNNVQEGAPYK